MAAFGVRISAATVLALSGLMKLGRPRAFTATVGSYPLIPDRIAPSLAGIVIACELVLSVLLFAGDRLRGSLTASALLFAVFGVTTLASVRRGRSSSCGCLGDGVDLNAPMLLGLLDLVFTAALFAAAMTSGNQPPSMSGAEELLAIGSAVAVGLAFWLVVYAATTLNHLRERIAALPPTMDVNPRWFGR